MKKYIITVIILLFSFNTSFWETWLVDENIDLNSASWDYLSWITTSTTNINDTNIINDAIAKKRAELNKILDISKETKDIVAIENLLKEIQIKKDLNDEFLKNIEKQVSEMKNQLLENENTKQLLESQNKDSSETKVKLNELEKQNKNLRNQLLFKEMLIKDLNENIKSAEILAEKYNNLLEKYTNIKKEVDDNSNKEKKDKMRILYFFLIWSVIVYFIKLLLYKKYWKNYEKDFLYFDLIFAIIFILFLISFFFYLYTQLYILLFFVSWYIITINAPIISSFIWSFIVFRKYTIWDIIKQWDDKGKIIKITPIYTTIRTINDDWVITNHNVNIPNNILVREKVDIISNPKIADHRFHIVLNLKEVENIFKIIDEIRDNIILKTLTNKLNSIDNLDEDIFKITYDQTEPEKVKINFFWRSTSLISRKLERKILWYVKNQIDIINLKKEEKEKNKENINNQTESKN